MKVSCLEEHMATQDIFAAWRRQDPELNDFVTRWTVTGDVAAPLLDLGEQRLHDMDIAGVDLAVLSLTTPGLQNLETGEAIELQGPTNDIIAAAARAHPDRLQGFATLAAQAPSRAAAELDRSIRVLGLNGVMLHSLSRGEFLDGKHYWEIYEVAERCRAPIYLHPSVPKATVAHSYYNGFGLLGTGAPGWHYQTGIALLRMILSGVFDKFPDLQVILGHWGEVVLFYLDRLKLLDINSQLKRPLTDYFRQNVFVTPGGIASQRYLRWTAETVGVDRIMHATDYPFNGAHEFAARSFIEESALPANDKAAIGAGNWQRIVDGIRRG